MLNYLCFSLSLRKGSFNTGLIHLVQKLIKNEPDASTQLIDLNDYLMPSYNADIQNDQGFPKTSDALAEKIKAADALIISSPEYNFSYPGHFKNTVDWLSRYRPMPWVNKPILLMSASPSLVGGNRGLWHLRVPFEATSAIVYPDMFSLASAHEAFNNGELKDPALTERLAATLRQFLVFVKALQGQANQGLAG
jgi:chromate reductase, NAD(P)H dehydrogenase (quinone)